MKATLTSLIQRISIVAILLVSCGVAHASPTTPTFVITPTPTHIGDSVTFSGCGYGKDRDLFLKVYAPDGSEALGLGTHISDSCFSTTGTPWSPMVSGTYEAYVFAPKAQGTAYGTYDYRHPLVDSDFMVDG